MTDRKLNIVLLDDDTDRAQLWAKRISDYPGCTAQAPEKRTVRDVIATLFKRRKEGRESNGDFATLECKLLDNADLLIIDYDLQNLDDDGEWTTGSEVAYVSRLVSAAKEIVIINQRGANRFDLTMIKAAESRADLDVGGVQLINPGLWQSSDFRGYRPWHWPNLMTEPKRVIDSIEFVKRNLDNPILISLGFSDDFDTGRALRPEVWGKLCVEKNTTFRELVAPDDEQQSIHLLFADVAIIKNNENLLASVAASVTRRWLEKWVLPNQDVLADIPHLSLRHPWVVKDYRNEASWHALETLSGKDRIIDGLDEYEFEENCMFSRPVFWCEALDVESHSLRPQDFNYADVPSLVFREDVSNFGDPDKSRDFPSQVLSIDNRRWITDLNSEEKMEGPQDISAVVFEPQSLLLS